MIRITWKLPQSFDLSYHSFAAVLGIPVHCKHWYHLSTLRVSGQARITFGENEVPFSDRCAETGRPDSWTVGSEIIWYDFPKRSAHSATAFRDMQKNYLFIILDGQYGGNLMCLLGLKKLMLPCPYRSLSWEQTSWLWPISFSLHIHECTESSETVRTGSLQKYLFIIFQWQVFLCTLLNVNTNPEILDNDVHLWYSNQVVVLIERSDSLLI